MGAKRLYYYLRSKLFSYLGLDMKSLEQEILKTIRMPMFTVTTDKNGVALVNKELHGYAFLHYSTMVAFLSNPSLFYKEMSTGRVDMFNYVVPKLELSEDKYTFSEIEKAVQVLILNNHIEDSTKDDWFDIEKRVLKITPDGFAALYTDYYIKEKQKERLSKNTSLIGWGTVLLAFASLTVSMKQCSKNDPTTIPVLDTLLQEYRQYKKEHSSKQKESDSLRPVQPFLPNNDTNNASYKSGLKDTPDNKRK